MSETTEDKNKESRPASDRSKLEEVRAPSSRRRTSRTAILAIVAVVAATAIAILAWAYWRSDSGGAGRPVPTPRSGAEQPGTTIPTTEPTIALEVETAARAGIKTEPVGEALLAGSAMAGQATTGVVQPNAYRATPVISLVGGIVRRVNAELGQNVKRGQTMAVVFSDELAMAQSRYLKAVAELDEHHSHHTRIVRLVEIGAASREELEQTTTKLRTAELDVASQRERLLLLGLDTRQIAQLKAPSQVSSEVTLPAPVSGVVISRTANPGEVIAADKEVLRIADLSSVWVIGQVYEKDLARVVVGSGASITSDTYPGRVFRGSVSYIDPTLDPATRTAQARIEMANPRQALKIGMFVNVVFAALGGAEATMPVIPKDAVQNINNQQVVFVQTEDPKIFAMRPVRLGPEVNRQYSVIEGLTVGERIVTEGSFLLRAEWLKLHPSGP
ncbi:MAG TPA: efflux RND transporter periplasmic adaptor subunit [Pyrinomonadaceae bacterium]|nr:efflux RND transporter periplasmic adaptor subunit [Pyrinomonadaceae bacterium]